MKVWNLVQIFLIIVLVVFSINMLTQKIIPDNTEKENFENNKEQFKDLLYDLNKAVNNLKEATDKIDKFNQHSDMTEDMDYMDEEQPKKIKKIKKKIIKKHKKIKETYDEDDEDDEEDDNKNHMEKFSSYSGISSKFGGDYLLLDN